MPFSFLKKVQNKPLTYVEGQGQLTSQITTHSYGCEHKGYPLQSGIPVLLHQLQ